MTPEQFAYWLQGFAELNPQAPNAEQWQSIRDHLQLVFKKVTPERVTGPAIASPALPPADISEAIRRFNEQKQRESFPFKPFRHPDPNYWLGRPVITC